MKLSLAPETVLITHFLTHFASLGSSGQLLLCKAFAFLTPSEEQVCLFPLPRPPPRLLQTLLPTRFMAPTLHAR